MITIITQSGHPTGGYTKALAKEAAEHPNGPKAKGNTKLAEAKPLKLPKKARQPRSIKDGKVPKLGATSSRIGKGRFGLPNPDPPRHKLLLGSTPLPETDGSRMQNREVYMGQVEILLLKGIVAPYVISTMLGIAEATAKQYIDNVHIRWGVLGNFQRMKQLRGEARARLDMIVSELWVRYESSCGGVQLQCLRYLLDAHDRRMELDNLTSKTLPMLGRDTVGEEAGEVMVRMHDHQRLTDLANQLSKFVGRDDAIDTEFKELTNTPKPEGC